MQIPLVMTIIGPDRPGLVEPIAGIVADHDGNWLESQMARLGGHFAGILRIQAPANREPGLTQALRALATQGLTVVVHPDRPDAPGRAQFSALLEIMGQDRPGIIRQISRTLATFGVNVEELHTECLSAPMSGETLFKAVAKLRLPADRDAAELRKALEKIASDLLVDISFAELTAVKHRAARSAGD
jgi:glycine cleavage system regulatory protein